MSSIMIDGFLRKIFKIMHFLSLSKDLDLIFFKSIPALTSVAWLVGALSNNQKAVGLIPGQSTYSPGSGTYRRQRINASLSRTLFLPLSLKVMKINVLR